MSEYPRIEQLLHNFIDNKLVCP